MRSKRIFSQLLVIVMMITIFSINVNAVVIPSTSVYLAGNDNVVIFPGTNTTIQYVLQQGSLGVVGTHNSVNGTWYAIKYENPGLYQGTTYSVTGNVAYFSGANPSVSYLWVKATNAGYLYHFDTPTSIGQGTSPATDSVSHIVIFWFVSTNPVNTPTPAPTESPTPTASPAPTESPTPTASPAPTESPVPTESPAPTESPVPTQSPTPTESPTPSTPTPSTPTPSTPTPSTPSPTEPPIDLPTPEPVPEAAPVLEQTAIDLDPNVPSEELNLTTEIPQGAPELPKTAGAPIEVFLFAGSLLAGSGLLLKRRKHV